MKKYIGLLFTTFLFSCGGNSSEDGTGTDSTFKDDGPPDASALITPCVSVGVIDLSFTEKMIADKIDEDNISYDTMFTEGDRMIFTTVLWRDSPEELKIKWKGQGRDTIDYILIDQPQSPYRTQAGIGIGTTLQKLRDLNGEEIKFNGFGWDLGGKITSAGEGKLKSVLSCIDIKLSGPENMAIPDELLGQVEVNTGNSGLSSFSPEVNSMILTKK